jgi:hypothetical protein
MRHLHSTDDGSALSETSWCVVGRSSSASGDWLERFAPYRRQRADVEVVLWSPGFELDCRVRVGASGFPIHRMQPMARWRMHPNEIVRSAPMAPGVNPVIPTEKPNESLEVVARALRRFLFSILILLGLAFAVVCYAELLGLVQFD